MPPRTAGIISDSGYVIYDDMPGKLANHEAMKPYIELDYEAFAARFLPYRQRAQRDPSYSGEQALADLACDMGVDPKPVLEARRTIRVTRTVREGVRETLEELKERGIPFVILSDTYQTGAELRAKYERTLGLGDLVTDFITSKDVQRRKPHPGMYAAAYHRIVAEWIGEEIPLRDVAFVGHDLDELEGAHQFGLRTLAVYYRGQREEIAFVPDGDLLSEFSDLLALL